MPTLKKLLPFVVLAIGLLPISSHAQEDETAEVSFGSPEKPKQVRSPHAKRLKQISGRIHQILRPIFENTYRPSTPHTAAKANEVAQKADAALRGIPGLKPLSPPLHNRKKFDRRRFPVGSYLLQKPFVKIELFTASMGSGFSLLIRDCRSTKHQLRHDVTYALTRSKKFPKPEWHKRSSSVIRADSLPVCTISRQN